MSLVGLVSKILFVGHSLVGPDLPPLLQTALGPEVQVQAQVINGAPLKFQWDNGAQAEGVDARAVLAMGQTDVLVLTEAIPLQAQIDWNDSAAMVAQYAGAAWAANPDTQVYIYETWHSLASGPGAVIEGDAGAVVPWRERITADVPLWESLTVEANAVRPDAAPMVRIIPAGQAMGLAADAIAAGELPGITSIQDLFSDDIHPNAKGRYLVAMVHVAAISEQSPEGLPAKLTRQWESRDMVISDDLALAMQRIAWAAVQGQKVQVAEVAAPVVVAKAQPALSAVTNPNLAMGLSGVNDWSVEQPFIDVMKTARPWIGHFPDQWGGMDYDALAKGGWLDTQGWPRGVPPEVTGLSTLILTDLPADAGRVAGRYVLQYQGKGELRLEGRAQNVQTIPGGFSFDFTPGEGFVLLTLTKTDPTDPIRNIAVVREDHLAAFSAGAVFNPDWLARIRGVKAIRFMDWMATNDSALAQFADRPMPDDFTYARKGVPMEVMVALANELHADPWFNVPHLADDGLVRGMAEIVRDGLSADLRASVEFSNEVWNWQFAQARWAEEQGKARWGQETTWVQFYALRAAEVMGIWTEVFGDQAKARLQRVIATQTGWIGLEEQILEAPLVVQDGLPPPAQSFDAYAVTGYFSALLVMDDKAAMVKDWLAESLAEAQAKAEAQGLSGDALAAFITGHRFDLATERAGVELTDGSLSGNPEDTLNRLLTEVWPHHANVAADHGLELVMYEGGTHVVGFGAQVDDAEITAFLHHLNYSPVMAALYARLLAGWAAITDAPFNAFVDVTAPGKWGSWGALRHLGDENPRWSVLAKGCGSC